LSTSLPGGPARGPEHCRNILQCGITGLVTEFVVL
jgi:hypothetical protein